MIYSYIPLQLIAKLMTYQAHKKTIFKGVDNLRKKRLFK